MSHPLGTNKAAVIRGAAIALVAYAAINIIFAASVPLLHVAFGLIGLGALLFWRDDEEAAPAVVESSTFDPESDILSVVRTLAPAIDTGDTLTRGRSIRIAHFCRRVGESFALDEQELRDLECAALLHDIGRTASHTDVRSLARKLRPEERKKVQSLPETGHRLLQHLPGLEAAAEIVYAHHEQPDGRGYPRKLTAESIPFGSRILMAVVAFDAMTTDRPYRRGLSAEEAYAELRKCAGTMFFPDVVTSLISLHQSGKIFEGFDPDQLARYGSGQLSSRAFENYLREHPELVQSSAAGAAADADDDLIDLGVSEPNEHAA